MVDGLLLGAVDKAAGIDDGHVGALRLGQDLIARAGQQIEHLLRIDLIFCTAQADKPDGCHIRASYSSSAALP